MTLSFALTLQDISKVKALFGSQYFAGAAVDDAQNSAAEIPAHHQIEVQNRPLQERTLNLRISRK